MKAEHVMNLRKAPPGSRVTIEISMKKTTEWKIRVLLFKIFSKIAMFCLGCGVMFEDGEDGDDWQPPKNVGVIVRGKR